MAEKYGNVRVKATTLERLQLTAEQIVRAVELGFRDDPGIRAERINPNDCGLSIDKLLCLLMKMREDHLARARKSNAARAARKRAAKVKTGE